MEVSGLKHASLSWHINFLPIVVLFKHYNHSLLLIRVSLKNAAADAETAIMTTTSMLWMLMLMTVVEVTSGNSQLVWHAGNVTSLIYPNSYLNA